MLKNLLIGTGLVGIGGVAGYFISRSILEREYQCDVAEMRALYQEKLEELEAMIDSLSGDSEETQEEEEEVNQEVQDALDSYRGQRRRSVIEYNKPSLDSFKNAMQEMFEEGSSVIVDPDGSEHLGDIDEDEEDISPEQAEYEAELEKAAEEYARRQIENMNSDKPYLIEPEEYRDGPEGYDHQALYYYSKDRTLCEDDDSPVEDEEGVVGFDYEDKLDMQTTCWVRNDQLQMLYEIHRIDESYTKVVINASETPREREFRLQGRRKQALDNR
jgi:hypothetical protein